MLKLLTGVRARLLLLILLTLVPIVLIMGYLGLQHRRNAGLLVQQEALRVVRATSDDHDRMIKNATRQLLTVLANLPHLRTREPGACSAFFASLLQQSRLYTNLGMVTPDGTVVCSGLPLAQHTNLADRSYVQRAIETRDFAVGDYQKRHVIGESPINFSYPVLDHAGKVQAVVFAAVNLDWSYQVTIETTLPQGAELVVIDREGTILNHYPKNARHLGKAVPQLPVVQAILARGEGVLEALDEDGIVRIYGFTQCVVHGPDMYMWIGIPATVAYAQANADLINSFAGLGLAGALALAAAWVFGDLLILRRVKALIHGTERLKAGDLASRVQVAGRDELSILAGSFNEMGDRLQAAHNQLAAQVKELTRHERELSLLRGIDSKILAEAPIADILSRGIEAFTELAEAKACVLVRLDQESGDDKSIAVYAPASEGVRWSMVPMRLRDGEGAIGRAIGTRAAVLIPDILIDPQMARYRDHLLALGIHALFAVPLCIEQTVVAVVGLGYPTARSFSDAEVRTMEGFANQLTIAWEQARLREEAKARWRLEEAARLKALFIANMSHELRTPLNSVLGFSELLQDAAFGTLTDKQRRHVGHIYESGKHLLALIEDILDLSKVEAGKIELRLEPLLLSDALESAVELIRGQVVKNGIALELSVEEKLPLIVADPIRLRQIVFNLLSNAVKFTPEGGRITMTGKSVRNGDDTEWVEIAVIDSGVGMKPDDLPKLFQPFVRLDTALDAQTKGTGLGLALTKHLVELHGGQITAASGGMGQGSTFTIRLPFAPQSGIPTL